MAKVKVVTLERSLPLSPPAGATGAVESRAYLSGQRDPLHLQRHALAPGATLTVAGDPADRLAYVFEGSVTARDKVLSKGSSLIAEFGAKIAIGAGPEGAVVLTFHETQRPDNARPGAHVHLLPRETVPVTEDLGTQNEMGGGIHADAACPNCKLWLHENDFHCKQGTTVPLHSHSEDEIIFVTAGDIHLGNRPYGPGTAIAVAADTVYGFEAGAGLSFINFRAASPTVTTPRGKHDEALMWLHSLGHPPYAHIAAAEA